MRTAERTPRDGSGLPFHRERATHSCSSATCGAATRVTARYRAGVRGSEQSLPNTKQHFSPHATQPRVPLRLARDACGCVQHNDTSLNIKNANVIF